MELFNLILQHFFIILISRLGIKDDTVKCFWFIILFIHKKSVFLLSQRLLYAHFSGYTTTVVTETGGLKSA